MNKRPIKVLMDDNLYPVSQHCPQGKYSGYRPLKCDKGRHAVYSINVLSERGRWITQVRRNGRVEYNGQPMHDRAAAWALGERVLFNMKRRLG